MRKRKGLFIKPNSAALTKSLFQTLLIVGRPKFHGQSVPGKGVSEMPKGKKKAKDEEVFLAASVHYKELLDSYRARPDRIPVVEAELSRLHQEFRDKDYQSRAQALKAGKEGG